MMHPAIRFLPAGDAALTIELAAEANEAVAALVLELDRRIAASPPHGLVEVVPTLRSLTVHLDPMTTDPQRVREAIEPLTADLAAVAHAGRRLILPVCYEPPHDLDLADVAQRCGLSADAVIASHVAATHRVLMIGFLPGQPYIGGLDPALHLPRRETPRTAVPAGAVAIATGMTTVYPLASPGGWHILGMTPARLFDLERPSPVLLQPGDEIRFRRVSLDACARMAADAEHRHGVLIEPTPTARTGSEPQR